MTELSPQAQAVLDAIYEIKDPIGEDGAVLAAVLRAAADSISSMSDDLGLMSNAFWAGRTSAAAKLRAIANELDTL